MRPLDLAFFVGEFPKISETFILNQITGMIDRGHDVTVYGEPASTTSLLHPIVQHYESRWKTRPRPAIPESRVARSFGALGLAVRHGSGNPKLFARTLNFRRLGRPAASLKLLYCSVPFLEGPARHDVISCHFADYGMLAIALRKIGALHGKIVTTFHGYDVSSYLAKAGVGAYRELFAAGDLFLPVSKAWRERILSLGCPKEKIAVHHMGIDCACFPFYERKDPSHARRDGEPQPVQLVSVARLSEKKGLAYSIQAVAQLLRSHPAVQYEIVGEGPLRTQLSGLIASLGLRGKIVLSGWKTGEEIARVLQTADIFLAPSVTATDADQEGIPVSIMEAMASHLPVISTLHSGIPELVQHGITGFLAPERDIETLASHLATLLSSPEVRHKMGRAGRNFVCANYNIAILNDKLERLFCNLADVLRSGQGDTFTLSSPA